MCPSPTTTVCPTTTIQRSSPSPLVPLVCPASVMSSMEDMTPSPLETSDRETPPARLTCLDLSERGLNILLQMSDCTYLILLSNYDFKIKRMIINPNNE